MPPPARRFVNVSLFLGAGASAPYGKPTTKDFKDALLQRAGRGDVWAAILSSSLHEDIEVVFTVLEDLIALAQNDGGRFYAKHNIQLKEEINIIYNAHKTLINEVYKVYAWDHEHDDTLQSTLGPLIAMLEGLNKTVNVFTTNYDRSVEMYCETTAPRIILVDGFTPSGGKYVWTGWPNPEESAFGVENQHESISTIRLYKLHGSLAWKNNLKKTQIIKNETEELSKDKNYGDLLIYPSKSPKISNNEPYNSTFEAFSSTLGLSDACIVVGFSFRDADVTAKFVELLKAGKLLIVVDPNALSTIEKSMPEYMDSVVVGPSGGPDDVFLSNNDTSGRGRIVAIQESLNPETSQKIADNALEYIYQWNKGVGT